MERVSEASRRVSTLAQQIKPQPTVGGVTEGVALLVVALGTDRGMKYLAQSRLKDQRKGDASVRRAAAESNVSSTRERMRGKIGQTKGVACAAELLGKGVAVQSSCEASAESKGPMGGNTADVLKALQDGTFTAEELLLATKHRAAEATAQTNSVVQFFDGAEEESKGISSSHSGILKGIPVSIKECFGVTGYHSTIGLGKFCNDDGIAHEDALIVKAVRAAGGVPFCHTNIPQTMLSFECSNPVYGTTTNPWDLTRGPGGSSGGESSLIASGHTRKSYRGPC